jgi:hypothetical protein
VTESAVYRLPQISGCSKLCLHTCIVNFTIASRPESKLTGRSFHLGH